EIRLGVPSVDGQDQALGAGPLCRRLRHVPTPSCGAWMESAPTTSDFIRSTHERDPLMQRSCLIGATGPILTRQTSRLIRKVPNLNAESQPRWRLRVAHPARW